MDSEKTSESNSTFEDSDRVDLTCHAAIFSIVENQLSLLLTERNEGPFRFQWELPSSTPKLNENLEAAALRACAPLLDTTSPILLQQLGAYGDPGRDPRHRTVAVVYWGVENQTDRGELLKNQPAGAKLVAVDEFTSDDFRFAFDHAPIALDALNALRQSLARTSSATRLCKPEFTISDLKRIYEVVFDIGISAGNFHRKVLNTPGFVSPADSQPQSPNKKGRPAQYFQAIQIVDVSPPFELRHVRSRLFGGEKSPFDPRI
jgi:8-oxo-dGTP diphosphatase